MWSLTGFYTGLGLDQCGGVPSHWVFKSIQSWEKLAANLGECGVLMRSKQYIGISGELDIDRNLPWVAASTPLVLYLMSRWCSCPKAAGGFSTDKNRTRARDCLHALCERILHVGPWEMQFFADNKVVYAFPRLPTGARPVTVHLAQTGFIDSQRLAEVVRTQVRLCGRRIA